jgi:anti-sigma factor RsiW
VAHLALYASGDVGLLDRVRIGMHVRQCERCRTRVAQFRDDAAALRETSAEMPEGLDWTRLAAEMTANIRVGLAAGECVAPKKQRKAAASIPMMWRPIAASVAIAVTLTVVLIGGWWLNMTPQDTQSLNRSMQALLHGRKAIDDRGPVIEASPDGIELRKDGGRLGVGQDSAQLVTVSVSTQGSASAHYVDQDTGQVTITSVYAQ